MASAKWTVMIYFAGDNNLSEEMIYAIKEMYRVGVTEDVDVIVQFDPSAIGAPVRRYVIGRKEIAASIIEHKEIRFAVKEEIAASTTRFNEIAASISKRPDIAAAAVDVTQTIGAAISAPKVMIASVKESSGTSRHTSQAQDTNQPLDVGNFVPDGLDLDGLVEKLKEEVHVRAPQDQRRAFRGGPENSASPKVLKEFISSSIRAHPADHYMVVLSGHGNGAIGDFLLDQNALTKRRPSSLSIPNLRIALEGVKEDLKGSDKIDILGMDSCLMSMAEVGHELKDSVKLLVGSEGFVQNTGWPYHRILKVLKAKPEPKELATAIVQNYISYYSDYEAAGTSTDQSVCDLLQLKPVLEPALKSLASALTKGLDKPAIKDAVVLAHWEAQSYKSDQYVDLYDFCDLLEKRCESVASIKKACTGVKEAIKSKQNPTVLESCYTGPAFQYSNGLSVYFPWSESDDLDAYTKNLSFAKKTGWGRFLRAYVKATRRDPFNELKQSKTHEKNLPFFSNPANEILETLVLVRNSPQGKPKGSDSTISMKNPPTEWYPSKCITEAQKGNKMS